MLRVTAALLWPLLLLAGCASTIEHARYAGKEIVRDSGTELRATADRAVANLRPVLRETVAQVGEEGRRIARALGVEATAAGQATAQELGLELRLSGHELIAHLDEAMERRADDLERRLLPRIGDELAQAGVTIVGEVERATARERVALIADLRTVLREDGAALLDDARETATATSEDLLPALLRGVHPAVWIVAGLLAVAGIAGGIFSIAKTTRRVVVKRRRRKKPAGTADAIGFAVPIPEECA